MADYTDMISRAATGSDALVPEPVSATIIENLPKQCATLQRARHVPMSTKTQRLPVLDVLPIAYFVGGDTGLKQATNQKWKNVYLIAEEIAAIVPIPESYLADVDVPVWDEVMPYMTEAVGMTIDLACLFGAGRPQTWSPSLYEGAVAAGNVVTMGTGVDIAQDVTTMGEMMARDGYSIDGFVARPGFNWHLTGMRSQGTNLPIFQPNLQGTPGGNLYGYPMAEVDNGSWDEAEAQLIAGDWDDALLGMRADISFKLFTEGVISDDSGKVVLNLMQQDSIAMRLTMRLAWATANPVTRLNANESRFPFVVMASAGPNS